MEALYKMMDTLQLLKKNSKMQKIYQVKKGPTIMGAWGLDVGTKEMKLNLIVVFPDKEISPVREYRRQKLYSNSGAKVLSDLTDFNGIDNETVEEIYNAVVAKWDGISLQSNGSGKCSIIQAYQALCEYVAEYEEPGKVFIRDGYGNILATYLQAVIDRLQLGYGRLELEKNFKTLGYLRTSDNTGHVYAYAIKTGYANNWYFSFKLQKDGEVAA